MAWPEAVASVGSARAPFGSGDGPEKVDRPENLVGVQRTLPKSRERCRSPEKSPVHSAGARLRQGKVAAQANSLSFALISRKSRQASFLCAGLRKR